MFPQMRRMKGVKGMKSVKTVKRMKKIAHQSPALDLQHGGNDYDNTEEGSDSILLCCRLDATWGYSRTSSDQATKKQTISLETKMKRKISLSVIDGKLYERSCFQRPMVVCGRAALSGGQSTVG
jgi:hypothetical protein